MTVVVATAGFEPGYKGGGPIRSLSNLTYALRNAFRVRVVTRDRDIGERSPYGNVDRGIWGRRNRIAILYSPGVLSTVRAFISAVGRDRTAILYLNSFFDRQFSIVPLVLAKLRIIRPAAIVVAPRGEFSDGALAIRRSRKNLFRMAADFVGLHKSVVWHSTSDRETEDIRRQLGSNRDILVARNISILKAPQVERPDFLERKQLLRIVFLSRISKKKNLIFALRTLKRVSIAAELRIAGPIEDEGYWAVCQDEIASMPGNVRIVKLGPVKPGDVAGELSRAHLFFLPTFGENYGHAIAEALMEGVPVLISDRTPWRDLERKGVGWDISLDDEDGFVVAIESCASRSEVDYQEMRSRAREYAEQELGGAVVNESVDLFRKVSQRG